MNACVFSYVSHVSIFLLGMSWLSFFGHREKQLVHSVLLQNLFGLPVQAVFCFLTHTWANSSTSSSLQVFEMALVLDNRLFRDSAGTWPVFSCRYLRSTYRTSYSGIKGVHWVLFKLISEQLEKGTCCSSLCISGAHKFLLTSWLVGEVSNHTYCTPSVVLFSQHLFVQHCCLEKGWKLLPKLQSRPYKW